MVDATSLPPRTPLPTATPRAVATAAPQTAAEVAGVQSETQAGVMDAIVTATLEPLFAGGKIGLLGAGVSIAAWVALKVLRGRKLNR